MPVDAPAAADREPFERRALLLAPTRRDAELTCGLLEAAGMDCTPCADMGALCDALSAGAAVLIVPEEALLADGRCLVEAVARQPVWSDITTVILSRSGSEGSRLSGLARRLGNVTIVERPVRLSTFASTVNVAFRARERQYQARDMLDTYARLAESERQANARTDELLARERAARAEAETANRMKDEFLATLSHELRTPLSAILGWSQMLRREGLKPETLRGGLDTIERNARAQTKIIEDLLDMSRIISGKIALDAKPADLAQIVLAAIETVRAALVAKDIELDVAPGLLEGGVPVLADASRMQQVFWNLLSNAIKFTPRQGRIRIELERGHSQWLVRIVDSGEGIKPDFLPFVFDRFRQADASITRRHGGLGLGLSIVRQLVELHGGRVDARSDGPGTGATFVVALPISALRAPADAGRFAAARFAAAEDAATDATASLVAAATATWMPDDRASLAGLRVLIVDDEPDARGMVGHLIESCGATIELAGSVAEALAAIERRPPGLLVSDIGMPEADGYSLISRVRGHDSPTIADVPAVALTAYARAEDRIRALRAGFNTHVPKPVEPDELIAAIVALIDRRKA